MSDTVLAQIAALKTRSTPELRDMWRELFGREPPVLGRRYLEDRIALPAFRNCTSAASPTGPGASSTLWPTSSSPRPRAGAIPGARSPGRSYGAQWKGIEHVVTVREHDFEYDGRPYKSLSAVAREIAGTRWNGWLFFGLRQNGTAR